MVRESVKFDVNEVVAALERLKDLSQKNVIRAAGTAGANVFLDEAEARVPVKRGTLKRDLRLRTRISYAIGRFSVGTSKKAKHAHLVELGTAPHYIPTPKGSPFSPPGGGVDHPGARPHPFLRPAYDAGKPLALERVKKNLLRRIKKEAAKSGYRRGLR